MLEQNIDLKPYNTFGITAKASHFAQFNTVDELDRLLAPDRSRPLLILGGGSNILLTGDIDALVLKNDIRGITKTKENNEFVLVTASAGENWHDLVLFCIENNWGGIENMSLIPGSVGAAPMQNIGAYGTEIKDVFVSLDAYHIASGELKTFSAEECRFGYRESVFKRELKGQYIIVSVTLQLTKKHVLNTRYGAIEEELKKMGITNPGIRDVSNAVISIRKSKLPDPAEIGNSGSFFKNPVVEKSVVEKIQTEFPDAPAYPAKEGYAKLAAGWLIEKAGWKGKTFGHYGVHKQQALVLVNYGGATGQEIFQLSEDILKSVKEKFGVTLEREVNIL